ncbi:NAD(P)/FAD-dependent oxidoreductase [Thetidibacter halocola]|uniref:NAD(P)/FAD-dependent oxidoreductase n=1 Tax=Thetidibacter halocola TaxID=2827239 RepID=A0A8J7WCK6_9RHOB|nr:NAD(P)/FAD-dependent oxidoreductase [Thetidibacter halocola]MBS0123201.1 NAD(P)/FAD-dependent oxidoreductase [Thetidibacter halocola]
MSKRTLILGAGAAGMMAAVHAGPGVLVIDHAKRPGEKIRISGGGRCNFTNLHCDAGAFLGQNPHFHKSALARYTQWDFIELVDRHGIDWHEKTLGQLFCDGKATQIVAMLLDEMQKAGAELWLSTRVESVRHTEGRFVTRLRKDGQDIEIQSENLILATGGKSIPAMGATGLSYDIARQFGHAVTDLRPALVPMTFDKGRFAELSGLSCPARVAGGGASFDEGLLFTHRGLSGPAILQVSSYWHEGEEIAVNLFPETDIAGSLRDRRRQEGKRALTTELATHLPNRLIAFLGAETDLTGNLGDLSDRRIDALTTALTDWRLKPTGTEGYRTAEVTLGGIETDGFDSRSMMSKTVPGLFAIGECLDVTGWLGGYNFQWAWASGVAAGRAITARK